MRARRPLMFYPVRRTWGGGPRARSRRWERCARSDDKRTAGDLVVSSGPFSVARFSCSGDLAIATDASHAISDRCSPRATLHARRSARRPRAQAVQQLLAVRFELSSSLCSFEATDCWQRSCELRACLVVSNPPVVYIPTLSDTHTKPTHKQARPDLLDPNTDPPNTSSSASPNKSPPRVWRLPPAPGPKASIHDPAMVHAIPLPLGSLFSRNRFDPRDYERTPLLEKLETKLEDKLERLRPEQQRLRRKAVVAKLWILDRIAKARHSSQASRARIRQAGGGFTDPLAVDTPTPAQRQARAEGKRKGHSRDDSVSTPQSTGLTPARVEGDGDERVVPRRRVHRHVRDSAAAARALRPLGTGARALSQRRQRCQHRLKHLAVPAVLARSVDVPRAACVQRRQRAAAPAVHGREGEAVPARRAWAHTVARRGRDGREPEGGVVRLAVREDAVHVARVAARAAPGAS